MAGEWLRKSGRTLERRSNTANGGPRFWVTFADGTRFATAADAHVNHVIGNCEFDGDVEVRLRGGEVIEVRAVDGDR